MLTDTIELVDQYLSHSPNDWFERLVEHLLLGGEGREDIVEGELLPHLPGALALDDCDRFVARRGRNDRKRPVLLFCCCVFVFVVADVVVVVGLCWKERKMRWCEGGFEIRPYESKSRKGSQTRQEATHLCR